MSFEKLISKKLGVVSVALFVLYKLGEEPSELTEQLSWLVTAIVLSYVLTQGILDYMKGSKP